MDGNERVQEGVMVGREAMDGEDDRKSGADLWIWKAVAETKVRSQRHEDGSG